MSTIDTRTTPREILIDILSIWILGALALTAALVVIGGGFVLGSAVVRLVLSVMLVLAIAFFAHQHRHRAELLKDPRMRHARERRGF